MADLATPTEWLFPEVYANKHGARIVSNILGPRPEVHFIRTNTLLATDERQQVHADIRFEHPEHPFAIAFNTCLVDVGPENGTTELWLGTQNTNLDSHRELGEPMIADEWLEERRKVRPPCYPRLKKGSIVLRDLRLWCVARLPLFFSFSHRSPTVLECFLIVVGTRVCRTRPRKPESCLLSSTMPRESSPSHRYRLLGALTNWGPTTSPLL
jgi:hypothetical protein